MNWRQLLLHIPWVGDLGFALCLTPRSQMSGYICILVTIGWQLDTLCGIPRLRVYCACPDLSECLELTVRTCGGVEDQVCAAQRRKLYELLQRRRILRLLGEIGDVSDTTAEGLLAAGWILAPKTTPLPTPEDVLAAGWILAPKTPPLLTPAVTRHYDAFEASEAVLPSVPSLYASVLLSNLSRLTVGLALGVRNPEQLGVELPVLLVNVPSGMLISFPKIVCEVDCNLAFVGDAARLPVAILAQACLL